MNLWTRRKKIWIARFNHYNRDRPHRGYRDQGCRRMETLELGKIRREEMRKEAA